MKLKPIGDFLNKNGFIKNGNNDFYKVHDKFVNCINFQKRVQVIFFINTGVHPVFENFAMNHRKEIDCYIRNRVCDGLSISLLHSFEGSEFVINEIKTKRFVFEYFDSLNKIFDAIRVVDIEERNICDELSGVSSVRLALMCMNYQYEKKKFSLVSDFANYGLAISRGPVPKKAFKDMIKITE
ncbi:DUF4304 domain-containing protein [Escherichia coli]|uniref:DUF4304 domain-containing protein n=1 Tax=Escherichia coli TaxID=562 RepID=UPI004062FAA4